MRRLILLRHAKSDRPAGVADRERPLNDRGRRAAAAVGAHLAREGFRPDLDLVSAAARTRETWAAVRAPPRPSPARPPSMTIAIANSSVAATTSANNAPPVSDIASVGAPCRE